MHAGCGDYHFHDNMLQFPNKTCSSSSTPTCKGTRSLCEFFFQCHFKGHNIHEVLWNPAVSDTVHVLTWMLLFLILWPLLLTYAHVHTHVYTLICSLSTPRAVTCGNMHLSDLVSLQLHIDHELFRWQWKEKSEIVQWHVTLLYLLRFSFITAALIAQYFMHTCVQKLASVDVHVYTCTLCHWHCEAWLYIHNMYTLMLLLLLFPWGGSPTAGGRGGVWGDTSAISGGSTSTGESSTASRPTAGSRTWFACIEYCQSSLLHVHVWATAGLFTVVPSYAKPRHGCIL